MGVTELVLSYKRLKLKLRVFLAGHIVAMVTCCATKLTATCSSMIGQFVDTMIVALTDRVVIMTHQTLSLGKYWKPNFQGATFRPIVLRYGTLFYLYCSPLNFLPHTSSKIIFSWTTIHPGISVDGHYDVRESLHR